MVSDERINRFLPAVIEHSGLLTQKPQSFTPIDQDEWSWTPHGDGFALMQGWHSSLHWLNRLTVTVDGFDARGAHFRELTAALLNVAPDLLDALSERDRLRAALEKAERERDAALTAAKKHLVGHVREDELEVASLLDCVEGLAASWQASSDDEDRVQRENAELREALREALGFPHCDRDRLEALLARLDAGKDGG